MVMYGQARTTLLHRLEIDFMASNLKSTVPGYFAEYNSQCRIYEGLAPISEASEEQMQQWPSEAFHECEGRSFSQPDLRSGDWSSYLVAVTGELADVEEDVLWPNQVRFDNDYCNLAALQQAASGVNGLIALVDAHDTNQQMALSQPASHMENTGTIADASHCPCLFGQSCQHPKKGLMPLH